MGERGIVLEFLHILFKPSPSVVTDTSPIGRGFLISRKTVYHHAVMRAYHQGVNLAYFVMLSVSRNIYFEILRLRLRLLRMTSENKISPQ